MPGLWRHLFLILVLAGSPGTCETPPAASNDESDAGRTLIVLAAPLASDPYYRPLRREILDFQIAFARQILGHDNVVILCDRQTLKDLAPELPADVLLHAPMRDIWIRDYSPVIPAVPVLWRYSAAAQAGNPHDADWVQEGFVRFANKLGLSFRRNSWILDGGNVVWDDSGQAIVSDRFLTDNHLDRAEADAILREQLGASRVAILPADPEDRLGHADGMAACIASNVVAVTRYGGEFQAAVEHALRSAFPGVRIVELETEFAPAAYDPAFGSAQGVYVNAVVTDRFLYLPAYGTAADDRALAQVSAATDRKVIPVSAGNIGKLGGSVRCLCSQMEGANARILIAAARRD